MHFRRIITTAVWVCFALQMTPPVSAATTPFPDMEKSWYRYKEAAQYLSSKGILGGYPDGTFKPKETINRAELLKIVFKGRSDVVPVTRRCFSDVNPDEWFAPYVCAAENRGIVKGYPNGTFQPGEAVNFAEAVKIVMNAYGHDVEEATGKDWYKPYTAELEKLQIMPEHSYVPWEPLSRERAADLLWRMLRHDEDRWIPRLSDGCGKASPSSTPTTVTVNGIERQFLLTIPKGYSAHDPTPLIIAFHGRTNSNEQVRSYMRLDRTATDSIIAYPAGISNGNGSFSWADPGNKASEIRDVMFFDAIVEKLAENYCVDMDRISVVGHSLGAWMANTVACVRGGAVMASATVGGDSVNTKCSGPAAAMIIHNPKDQQAPFSGAEFVLQQREKANFCSTNAQPTGPAELSCVRHTECATGNDILWCPHTIDTDERGVFYPHNWPRNTATHIVDFFKSIK